LKKKVQKLSQMSGNGPLGIFRLVEFLRFMTPLRENDEGI
jgi:hypothetical protein